MPKIHIPYFEHKSIRRENKEFTLFENNDFSLTTNVDNSTNIFTSIKTDGEYTFIDTPTADPIKLNVDFKDVRKYIKYRSCVNVFSQTIDFLKQNYLGAISIKKSTNQNNVSYSQYNPFNDTTTIKLLLSAVKINDVCGFKPTDKVNLIQHKNDFLFEYNTKFYNINDISLDGKTLILNVGGQLELESNIIAYIKPTTAYKKEYERIFSEVERYFVSNKKEKYFSIVFYDNEIDGKGRSVELEREFRLYKSDKYNIDFETNYFAEFKDAILAFAENLDITETNILKRKFAPDSLFFDTDNVEKINTLFDVFSFGYDSIWQSIMVLKNIKTIEEEIDTDNYFVDLLYKQLGFTVELPTNVKKTLALNAGWIFRNKGKRGLLLNLKSVFGIGDNMFVLNEHVYQFKPFETSLIHKEFYDTDTFYPFDINGLTVKNRNIFENFDYWDYYNIRTDVDNEITKSYSKITENKIYEKIFVSSSDTISIGSDNCYILSKETKYDDIQETILNECGCPILVNDYALKITTIKKQSDKCKKIVLDWWETCSSSGVTINYNIHGGTPPYIVYGNGYNTLLSSGTTYSFFVEDANNCMSNEAFGTANCIQNKCVDNPIIINSSYNCIKLGDEITGEATIDYNIGGGVPPYILSPNYKRGDILSNGAIYEFEVTDSLGCKARSQKNVVNCGVMGCKNINLNTTCELTSQPNTTTRIVNITYDLNELDFSVYVENVTLTVKSQFISNGTGIDTRTFSTQNGANHVEIFASGVLDFDVEINVLLTNGCRYFLAYSFVDFNTDKINIPTNANYILIN